MLAFGGAERPDISALDHFAFRRVDREGAVPRFLAAGALE